MPRANRLFETGCVWHLTQRCHKKEFLLRFDRDRRVWRHWLYEARRRYGLCVLNYIVTSNHIHLMAVSEDSRTIPRSMQLVSGRTAQQYNNRKQRRGAFWEDRYHAVPIVTQDHFIQCLTYVDLNMVRAGVVTHPSEWLHAGFNEIQAPRRRYVIIDLPRLAELAGVPDELELRRAHRGWVDGVIQRGDLRRDPRWTCPDILYESLKADFDPKTRV